MDPISTGLLLVRMYIAVTFFFIMFFMQGCGGRTFRYVFQESEGLMAEKMKKSRKKFLNYEEIAKKVDRNGISAMTSNMITPPVYIVIKSGMALICVYAGIRIHMLAALPLGILGYLIPDFISVRSNQRDNRDMLDDLKNLYDILYIQLSSGEHVVTVLSECYLHVKNKRLKMGLQEMTSTISGRHDIEKALISFQSKFHNDYIDALVISILQSLKTGQAAQMFEDMSHQIEGMDRAVIIREKQIVQNKVLLFQILVYIVIILAVVYLTCIGASPALSLSLGS